MYSDESPINANDKKEEKVLLDTNIFLGYLLRLIPWIPIPLDVYNIFKDSQKLKKKISFIVEGESLAIILGNEELTKKFIEISKDCNSVVCCRVTPQ